MSVEQFENAGLAALIAHQGNPLDVVGAGIHGCAIASRDGAPLDDGCAPRANLRPYGQPKSLGFGVDLRGARLCRRAFGTAVIEKRQR